jgi:long-chain acyl-CoA synthetase
LEWSLAARGAYSQSMTVFTVYANLGEEALVYALNQGSSKIVVANASTLKLMSKIVDQVKSLTTIIYVDGANDAEVAALKKKGTNLYSFSEVESLGAKNPQPVVAPKADDLACVMYTSGSTGMPKGVMIPHKAIIASATVLPGVGIEVSTDDSCLHYLPMAHIFAFTCESVFLLRGASLGYGSPRTLSNVGVRNCEGDIKELRPTILIAVPAVYEKIKHGVLNRINKSSPVVRTLFNLGFKAKLNAMRTGGTTPIWDRIVFNKLKDNVGGRLKYFVSGSAPLSADVQDFVRVCFGAPVLQGYGLTETCSAGCAQYKTDMNTGRVGGPWPSVEIKLVDCADMGYTHQDKPNPRGEIWIRGPSVSMGYYKDEAKTREAFTDDGWFMTGDIGAMFPDGTFAIIDRKKHLIKPPHGEYIALEKLESIYRNCSFIEALCVFVDAMHYDCVALAVPNRDILTEWAKANKIANADDYNALVQLPAVREHVLRELVNTGRKLGLKSIETVRAVRLYPEPWTPQNKFLTAAMKLNRPFVTTELKKDIEAMYKELEAKNS